MSESSRTIFLSCPSPAQAVFNKLKPLMSKPQFRSIGFAERHQLTTRFRIPAAALPPELGGTWSVDEYIAARCRAEGVADCEAVRPYTGYVIDWTPIDRFEERRLRRLEARDTASAVESVTETPEAVVAAADDGAEADSTMADDDEPADVPLAVPAEDEVTQETAVAAGAEAVEARVSWRERMREWRVR
jgi:hypothetical protein